MNSQGSKPQLMLGPCLCCSGFWLQVRTLRCTQGEGEGICSLHYSSSRGLTAWVPSLQGENLTQYFFAHLIRIQDQAGPSAIHRVSLQQQGPGEDEQAVWPRVNQLALGSQPTGCALPVSTAPKSNSHPDPTAKVGHIHPTSITGSFLPPPQAKGEEGSLRKANKCSWSYSYLHTQSKKSSSRALT